MEIDRDWQLEVLELIALGFTRIKYSCPQLKMVTVGHCARDMTLLLKESSRLLFVYLVLLHFYFHMPS
jgi:hypothetical protein